MQEVSELTFLLGTEEDQIKYLRANPIPQNLAENLIVTLLDPHYAFIEKEDVPYWRYFMDLMTGLIEGGYLSKMPSHSLQPLLSEWFKKVVEEMDKFPQEESLISALPFPLYYGLSQFLQNQKLREELINHLAKVNHPASWHIMTALSVSSRAVRPQIEGIFAKLRSSSADSFFNTLAKYLLFYSNLGIPPQNIWMWSEKGHSLFLSTTEHAELLNLLTAKLNSFSQHHEFEAAADFYKNFFKHQAAAKVTEVYLLIKDFLDCVIIQGLLDRRVFE